MARYSIPQQVKAGFVHLLSLTPEQIKALNSVIQNAKIGDGPKYISVEFSEKTGLRESTTTALAQSLFSMVNLLDSAELSAEVFANEFAESFMDAFDDVTLEEKEKLASHLKAIIPSVTKVKMTLKARDLISDNSANYMESKIISDIRIVYEEDLSKQDQYAVVVHHLKIIHFNDFKRDVTNLSLDFKDLQDLKKVVDRAIEKDKLIKEENYKLNFINLK